MLTSNSYSLEQWPCEYASIMIAGMIPAPSENACLVTALPCWYVWEKKGIFVLAHRLQLHFSFHDQTSCMHHMTTHAKRPRNMTLMPSNELNHAAQLLTDLCVMYTRGSLSFIQICSSSCIVLQRTITGTTLRASMALLKSSTSSECILPKVCRSSEHFPRKW